MSEFHFPEGNLGWVGGGLLCLETGVLKRKKVKVGGTPVLGTAQEGLLHRLPGLPQAWVPGLHSASPVSLETGFYYPEEGMELTDDRSGPQGGQHLFANLHCCLILLRALLAQRL